MWHDFERTGMPYAEFEKMRLKSPSNDPFELALMLTCKEIANEMRGLALHVNAIVFEETELDLEFNGSFRWEIHNAKMAILRALSPLISEDLVKRTADLFPSCVLPTILSSMAVGSFDFNSKLWARLDYSLEHYPALRFVLQELRKHSRFDKLANQALPLKISDMKNCWFRSRAAGRIVDCEDRPWVISRESLHLDDELVEIIGYPGSVNPDPDGSIHTQSPWVRRMTRQSRTTCATALAISFLKKATPAFATSLLDHRY